MNIPNVADDTEDVIDDENIEEEAELESDSKEIADETEPDLPIDLQPPDIQHYYHEFIDTADVE